MHLHSACLDWRWVWQNHSWSPRFCNNYTLKLQQNLGAIIIFPFSPPIQNMHSHCYTCHVRFVCPAHFLITLMTSTLNTISYKHVPMTILDMNCSISNKPGVGFHMICSISNNLEHAIFSSLSTVSQSLFFSSWSLLMQVGRCIRVQIMEVDETKNNVILSEKEACVSILKSVHLIA
jgi:hypothetical protein